VQRCTVHKERNLLLSGVNRTESANKRFSALECLLLGVKRTSISGGWMSACSHNATFGFAHATWILPQSFASLLT